MLFPAKRHIIYSILGKQITVGRINFVNWLIWHNLNIGKSLPKFAYQYKYENDNAVLKKINTPVYQLEACYLWLSHTFSYVWFDLEIIQLRILITYYVFLKFRNYHHLWHMYVKIWEIFIISMHGFMQSFFETPSQFNLIGKPLETHIILCQWMDVKKCEFEVLEHSYFIQTASNKNYCEL